MYLYNEIDQQLINNRANQFRGQVQRYLAGVIAEDAFRILRLQNGLYIQRHAPMLRIAINYGLLNSTQLRAIAAISRTYDHGYAHFTTRQNVQLNWPELQQVPDILDALAKVQMHAIQTSGSCIRSVGADHFAGIDAEEVEDPRPWAEIIRQWAALHPEFAYLPRKFKFAVTGAVSDRAATQVHDIGLHLIRNAEGALGFEVLVGGGLGRTPMIGKVINSFLAPADLLTYMEAILRVYNLLGNRDNKYKARIKILVAQLGIDNFRERVEAEWQASRATGPILTAEAIAEVKQRFQFPTYDTAVDNNPTWQAERRQHHEFDVWCERNTRGHKVAGYQAVTLVLKDYLKAPGDLTHQQMDAVADLADRYNGGEIRTTHTQNMVFAHVRQSDLLPLWRELDGLGLARPVVGTINDLICCPGLDFCSLANAETLSVAAQIQSHFDDFDALYNLGEISLKMSGCINACAHHHVGNIGILGVDKKGESFYQIELGGSATEDASLGKVLGKALPQSAVPHAIEVILDTFVAIRQADESFLQTVRRAGLAPFKESVYAIDY